MKFALKWAAVLAAYAILAGVLVLIDPRFLYAERWVTATAAIVCSGAVVVYAWRTKRQTKRYLAEGHKEYQDASYAWANAAHNRFRTEPIGDGVSEYMRLICACQEIVGAFHKDDKDQLIALGKLHLDNKVRELADIIAEQRRRHEPTGGEVKQTSAV